MSATAEEKIATVIASLKSYFAQYGNDTDRWEWWLRLAVIYQDTGIDPTRYGQIRPQFEEILRRLEERDDIDTGRQRLVVGERHPEHSAAKATALQTVDELIRARALELL